MLSVVPLSRPLDSLWTSFVLLIIFFFRWLQVLLVSFTPTYVFSYFWLKINSILSVSSCVTSYSLQWILKINSISVLLVLPPFASWFVFNFLILSNLPQTQSNNWHYKVTIDGIFSVYCSLPQSGDLISHLKCSKHAVKAERSLGHKALMSLLSHVNCSYERCVVAMSNRWWRLGYKVMQLCRSLSQPNSTAASLNDANISGRLVEIKTNSLDTFFQTSVLESLPGWRVCVSKDTQPLKCPSDGAQPDLWFSSRTANEKRISHWGSIKF